MNNDWRSSALPEGVTHRLILLRHGETDAAFRGRCYGKLDVALSVQGQLQISASATLIQPLKPAAIYTSPLLRAKDTAEVVGQACQLEPIIENGISELDFGDFEGLRYEEAEREYPEIFQQWMRHPTKVCFPNGESYDQMVARVVESTSRLKQHHKQETIVVVAHGGVNRIVLAKELKLASEHIFRLDQYYGAINCIDYYDDTPLVRTMNWLP
jgi:alpha-ribazole phosphatase